MARSAKSRNSRRTDDRWEIKRPRRRMFPLLRDESAAVVRRGERWNASDVYHWFQTISLSAALLACAGIYLAINIFFAFFYFMIPGQIAGVPPGNFAYALFFSIETFSTIGYGVMYPTSTVAHVLVSIESLAGILTFALITSLLFMRFTRPHARILFSGVAVIAPFEGVPTFSFRMANERGNQILQAEVRATLVRDETTKEGMPFRRQHELKLTRNQSSFFGLSWTVMHPIDGASPLHGVDLAALEESEAEIVVLVSGVDDTLHQQVHARFSYTAAEILWGRRFVDILARLEDGRRLVDLTRFHDTEAAE
jgi:inward rectifier potassium channel